VGEAVSSMTTTVFPADMQGMLRLMENSDQIATRRWEEKKGWCFASRTRSFDWVREVFGLEITTFTHDIIGSTEQA
jgi:hypothetical protein